METRSAKSSLTHRRSAAREVCSESESDIGGYSESEEKPPTPTETKAHSKGDKKLAKIVKRLVFGTLLLFILVTIIAAGHLSTLFFVRMDATHRARHPRSRRKRLLL